MKITIKTTGDDIILENMSITIFFSTSHLYLFELLKKFERIDFDVVVYTNNLFSKISSKNRYKIKNFDDIKDIPFGKVNLIEITMIKKKGNYNEIVEKFSEKPGIYILLMRSSMRHGFRSKRPYGVRMDSELMFVSRKFYVDNAMRMLRLTDVDKKEQYLVKDVWSDMDVVDKKGSKR